ncbi:MAG: AbgT family transporter, partial [Myxococcales bacterium]|nr:AbgT family transporter [Myxococcales bacterium]
MTLLDRIERLGNRLPDPTTLFLLGAFAVMALSQVAVSLEWEVRKTVSREVRVPVLGPSGDAVLDPSSGEPLTVVAVDPATGEPLRELANVPIRARSLLDSDGIYYAISSLVTNFKNFPPLAIVLVGMLGIGLADRTGFIGALLKALLLAVPPSLLTPAVFLVGVISSVALDAGYVVLPPVAAALFAAVGRSPLVGLGAVFAGVSAGFGANLTLTSLDTILAGFSEAGARLLDPEYAVAATANLHFMIASTLLLTAVGWLVTAHWVEPRYASKPTDEGGPAAVGDADTTTLSPEESRGLRWGTGAAVSTLGLFTLLTWLPGAPLAGMDGRFPRWVAAIVPLIFLGFLVPGLAYGFAAGRLRSDRDVAKVLGETMAGMGPYIVLAFFAAQFVAYFSHSRLGEMLAIAGGAALAQADLPTPALVGAFVGVVAAGNLAIGSMSAKYAFFAPVFVPMFMQVGISPELTQAAYRVGDSVTNVITPLNPYVVIILVFMQRWVPRAGIGSLVALMLPYAIAFGVTWSALLLIWVALGWPLGPAGPLTYA